MTEVEEAYRNEVAFLSLKDARPWADLSDETKAKLADAFAAYRADTAKYWAWGDLVIEASGSEP